MSKVINVLAAMANDATLTNESELSALITVADISTEQKKAILAQDGERLAKTITDFPMSMCSVIHPAEEEEQESQEESETDDAKSTRQFAVNA